MRVSINGGTPIAGWFIMEKPIKMDDLGIPPFQETSISMRISNPHVFSCSKLSVALRLVAEEPLILLVTSQPDESDKLTILPMFCFNVKTNRRPSM